jgi:hypothetical protein
MSEINSNLDKGSLAIFKEALRKLKTGQVSEIDLFTNEVSWTSLTSISDSLSLFQIDLKSCIVPRKRFHTRNVPDVREFRNPQEADTRAGLIHREEIKGTLLSGVGELY